MRGYTAEKYQNLVEETTDTKLQNFMEKEREFVAHIPDAKSRTFVDLGAGHGRIIGDLAAIGKNVIAIEINPDMYKGLEQQAKQFSNVSTIHGDILELDQLLKDRSLSQPVFLIVQNSLGTIEGDYKELFRVVENQARQYGGELLLSFFRQSALKDWGLGMYDGLKDMVGEIDPTATDTDKGIFVSKTGYTSKWWTDEEIETFKQHGQLVAELVEPEFHIIRLAFN